jgi:amino-acid N-acetyltransferase
VTLRSGHASDAAALFHLIAAHAAEGHLLARAEGELAIRAPRFVVAHEGDRIVGCAELAALSGRVAEVRSLVVERSRRGWGIGGAIVTVLRARAAGEGYESLCAFTHDPSFFVRLGCSLVPHAWIPEKIAHDCSGCAQFRHCGQQAVVLPLDGISIPSLGAAVHGAARLT